MRLYKYRGFANFELALDIFVNKRLYAADFQSLNDPMEGRFIYSRGSLDKCQLRKIRGQKAEYKVLSLSETPYNMLMWSYYAEGHKGFVVGIEVDDSDVEIKPVQYVDDLKIDEHAQDVAKLILTKKLTLWSHEKEHRAFKRCDCFVSVKIKEVIFGVHAEQRQKELLTEIAKKFCKNVKISQVSRNQLETGCVDEHEI